MWWFSRSAVPDTEIQRNFSPEALQAVFDQNRGDVSRLEKPLQVMTKAVETSSFDVQRSLLRELKVSGVVGFACSLLLVYGQQDQAFAWACEVLRLVQIIEENDIADSINQVESLQRRQVDDERMRLELRNKSRRKDHRGDVDGDGQNDDGSDDDDGEDNRGGSTQNAVYNSAPSLTASSTQSPTIACAVVPLLRAASTRLPSLTNSDPSPHYKNSNYSKSDSSSSSGFFPAVAFFASLATSAAQSTILHANSASQQIVIKYSSLIVNSAILGVLPDYGADEVFSAHSQLALQVLSRIVPGVLNSTDSALCAPLAAACVLSSSRERIESLLLPKTNQRDGLSAATTSSLGTPAMDPLGQLRMWRESTKLCLQIFRRASNSVRPRDVTKISSALEHVLRYFYSPGDEGALLSRIIRKKESNNYAFNASSSSSSSHRSSFDASSIELRISLGHLIREAAQVLFCAANDGWLPISRSFFDHLVDAAFISLQDPETVSSFGACFSCLPRISSVALRGGCIDVNKDILPRIHKLWDKVDYELEHSFVPTSNRDAIVAVANGIQNWVNEFYSLSNPSGRTSTDQAKEFDHRKLSWGSQARKSVIEGRVVDTVLKLFDLCCFSVVERMDKTKNNKNNNNNHSRTKNHNKNNNNTNNINNNSSDETAFSFWFPQLWHTGVVFALLRESKKFTRAMSKNKVRDTLLKFAQTVATDTCPIVLEFWHILPKSHHENNNNNQNEEGEHHARDLVVSSSPGSGNDDDDENDHRQSMKKNAVGASKTYHLLQRLFDACRFVRRDQPPPEFVIRTLQLLVSSPCPTCGYGIPFDTIASHVASSSLPTNQQQQKTPDPSTKSPSQQEFNDNNDDYDDGFSSAAVSNNNMHKNLASMIQADRRPNDEDADDDDDLKSISALSLISSSATPVANALLIMEQRRRQHRHDHIADDNDPDGGNLVQLMDLSGNQNQLQNYNGNMNIDTTSRTPPSFVMSSLHIVNHDDHVLLDFPFASTETAQAIILILDEASLRLQSSGSASGDNEVHTSWVRLANVCFDWLNRPELRGLPRLIQSYIRDHVYSTFLRKNNKNISSNHKNGEGKALSFSEEQRRIRRKSILEKKLDEALRAPIDRLDSTSLLLLARTFTRGKGWFWNDRSISILRDILDESRVLHLFENRQEVWARCVLAENVKFETVATIRVLKNPRIKNAESSNNNNNDDENNGKEEQEQEQEDLELNQVISSNFVVWVLQKHVLCKAQTATKSDVIASQSLSYHILGYLFSVSNPPKDFDSLARTMLLLDIRKKK